MCQGLMRMVLVVLNIIFTIVFLAIAVFGALLKWSMPIAKTLVETYLKPLLEKLQNSDTSTKSPYDSDAIAELINESGGDIGLVLFIIGAILTFICILGMFGACCKSRIMLILYCILMSVLIIAQIAFVVIYFAKRDIIFNPLKKVMDTTVEKYKGYKGSNAESFVWNLLMMQLSCCGVTNYKDFENAKDWDKTVTYKGRNAEYTVTLKAPIPCCKFNKETFEREDDTCPQEFNDKNSNWNSGCFTAFEDELEKVGQMFMYVAIGIIVLQVLLVLMAIYLICKSDEFDDDDSFYDDRDRRRRDRGGRDRSRDRGDRRRR